MMTNEETKKHIDTEVSGICDKIAEVYYNLWEQFLINQGGMDSSLLDDRKQHNIECDELCKRVKELGHLTQHFRDEIEELRLALQDPDIH